MATDPRGELDITNIQPILRNDSDIASRGGGTAHFTSVGGALFPQDPSVGDVKQQSLADCYLLAAALAILAQPGGPKKIAGLMREDGGRVIVRLHDKKVAKYVSVQKSIRKNSEKHNGGALWATFLEKAYAAADFAEPNKRKDDKPDGKVLTGYAKLNRGHASDAYNVLLGGDDKSGTLSPDAHNQHMDAWMFNELWTLDASANEARFAMIIKSVFGGRGELWHRFFQWRSDLVKSQWKVLLDAHGDIKEKKDKTSTLRRRVMRLEDLEQFFKTHNLDAETANPIMEFVKDRQLLAGKRGTGQYTKNQLGYFRQIKEALAAGKPVVLGTTEHVGSKTSGFGKSGGEAISKGLAGGHAYAVVGVREDVNPAPRKFLLVQNPWGSTGREYYSETSGSLILKARQANRGQFDLELSDLSKRFHTIYISGQSIGVDQG